MNIARLKNEIPVIYLVLNSVKFKLNIFLTVILMVYKNLSLNF